MIDGRETGKLTPATIADVPIGDRIVEIIKDGYQPVKQTVHVETAKAAAVLVPSTGKLEVTSVPKSAAVSVDGRSAGNTPVVLDMVQPGEHSVKVRLQGYAEYSTTARITAGSTTKVEANLNPLVGSLEVISKPAGAAVKVDGIAQDGITPLTVKNLRQGEHTVDVEKAAYEPYSTKVQVITGNTSTVIAMLKTKCIETDNGNDYKTKGTATVEATGDSKTDSCMLTAAVVEGQWVQITANNEGKTATKICLNAGYQTATRAKRCTDGSEMFLNITGNSNCASTTPYSDCYDFNKCGNPTASGVVWNSIYCERTVQWLQEYYCQSGQISRVEYKCLGRCSEGVCAQVVG
jgi:hypothetical protein